MSHRNNAQLSHWLGERVKMALARKRNRMASKSKAPRPA
jgi:hypothetical protein